MPIAYSRPTADRAWCEDGRHRGSAESGHASAPARPNFARIPGTPSVAPDTLNIVAAHEFRLVGLLQPLCLGSTLGQFAQLNFAPLNIAEPDLVMEVESARPARRAFRRLKTCLFWESICSPNSLSNDCW